MCIHRDLGCPCYGPYPEVLHVPSFMTPKRANNPKDRGGKKDEDKEELKAKKGKKTDPTQKKLADYFVGAASSSLQLTN